MPPPIAKARTRKRRKTQQGQMIRVQPCGRVLREPEPDRLLAEAAAVPAGSDGLVMLPYLLGERAPYWSSLPQGASA